MSRDSLYRIVVSLSAGAVGMLTVLLAFAFAKGDMWLALYQATFIGFNVWLYRRNRNQLRALRTPTPPTDVKLTTDNGTVIAVDCYYDGFNGNVHTWCIIPPPWLDYDYATTHKLTVSVDELPANTAIDMTVRGRPEDTDG